MDKTDDSGYSDNISIKSNDTIVSSVPRAHNFVRTHFQRATQCDFCGKKIWLKDAMQCRECYMCCHKKCINKCQNATVCGPVDCSSALQQNPTAMMVMTTPEFMVTDADQDEIGIEPLETETAAAGSSQAAVEERREQQQLPTTPTSASLGVHRSSLTGLLAQGIKRVNSANNLAIPGIVSTIAGVTTSTTAATASGGAAASSSSSLTPGGSNAKSLPPTPQHSPSSR